MNKFPNAKAFSQFIKISKLFIKSFCSIEYVVNDNDKTHDITEVLKDSFDNKTYMSVPYEVLNATSIKLKFNVRDNVLVYNLK